MLSEVQVISKLLMIPVNPNLIKRTILLFPSPCYIVCFICFVLIEGYKGLYARFTYEKIICRWR